MVRSLLMLIFLSVAFTVVPDEPHRYLHGKIPEDNFRYNTFVQALDLMRQREVKTIVETGTARHGANNCYGDGCATLIFTDWAEEHDAIVYSVDINEQALACAQRAVGPSQHVQLVHTDSVEFLKNFGQPIDMLYLDSFDFEVQDPAPSQQHHLKEIMAAMAWLTDTTIVMIDDCALPHGGKGKLVIEYLLAHGWKIVAQGYQVILVRG